MTLTTLVRQIRGKLRRGYDAAPCGRRVMACVLAVAVGASMSAMAEGEQLLREHRRLVVGDGHVVDATQASASTHVDASVSTAPLRDTAYADRIDEWHASAVRGHGVSAHGCAADLPFDTLVRAAADEFEVEPALLHAVIATESGYDAGAISRRGAIGLMQIMPHTGARFGFRRLEDPAVNVRAGAKYLRWLMTRFDGDMRLVLAAYNAGEGAVLRHGRQVPPYRETQAYVRKVMTGYQQLRVDAPAREMRVARQAISGKREAMVKTAVAGQAPTGKSTRDARTAMTASAVTNDDGWRMLRGLGELLTRGAGTSASSDG